MRHDSAALADACSRQAFRRSDETAIKAVAQTRLAYVVTGNADVDEIVKAGLSGPDAVSRAAHRARSRRAGRHQSGARRAQRSIR
jgi:hypothetical protein